MAPTWECTEAYDQCVRLIGLSAHARFHEPEHTELLRGIVSRPASGSRFLAQDWAVPEEWSGTANQRRFFQRFVLSFRDEYRQRFPGMLDDADLRVTPESNRVSAKPLRSGFPNQGMVLLVHAVPDAEALRHGGIGPDPLGEPVHYLCYTGFWRPGTGRMWP